MTHPNFLKTPVSMALSGLLLTAIFGACSAPETRDAAITERADPQTTGSVQTLPPIRKALSCLPGNAAIIAAHRGTDERWTDQAENSVGGLDALIQHGTLMAEIDVAGLKDDTLITFHDGVWDKISTGKGPIASSTQPGLEKILLKTRAGKLTADRPPEFTEMLRTAKGKLYLEIDFKSSANPRDVIGAIRDADMADQVLLIAYNADQAAQLEQLAPEMLRSNPTDATKRTHAVWLGYDVGADNTANTLKNQGNYIIGRIGDPNRQPPLRVMTNAADILVTDQAERYDGIIGLTKPSRAAYEACLKA